MKNITTVFAAILVILFMSTACDSKDNHVEKQETKEETRADEIIKTPEKEKRMKIVQGKSEPEYDYKNVRDNIELDFALLSLQAMYISEELEPDDVSGVYMSYEDIAGSKYFILKGQIKNLSSNNIDSNYVKASYIINGTYTYDADLIITANSASITDYAITPFEESVFFIYSSIPDDAVSIFNKGELVLNFDSSFERPIEEEYQYNYKIPIDF